MPVQWGFCKHAKILASSHKSKKLPSEGRGREFESRRVRQFPPRQNKAERQRPDLPRAANREDAG